MNADQKHRQTSLRAFFGYLTLVCVLMGVARAAIGFDSPFLFDLVLGAAAVLSFGAALGSLLGRPMAGAVVAFALMVIVFCLGAYIVYNNGPMDK